jgi:DNA replication protein DnaC
MKALGAGLETVTAAALAARGPEVVARWELTRLPASADLLTRKTELGQRIQRGRVALEALAETDALGAANKAMAVASQQQGLARAEHELSQVDAQLSQAAERDRLQAERPDGCVCLGLGGSGILLELGGLSYWQEPCLACPEGQALAARLDEVAAVEERREAEQRQAEEAAAATKALRERLAAAEIPPHFAALTLATFPDERSKRAAVERMGQVATQPLLSSGVFLWGQPGTGKTGLEIAALRAWIEAGHRGFFVKAPDFLDRLRPGAERVTELTGDALMARVLQTPLLVFDDLGAQRTTQWARERLFLVIDGRHDSGRPTLYTSNFDLAETAERLAGDADLIEGKRMVSRIVEVCDVIEVKGSDLRLRRTR